MGQGREGAALNSPRPQPPLPAAGSVIPGLSGGLKRHQRVGELRVGGRAARGLPPAAPLPPVPTSNLDQPPPSPSSSCSIAQVVYHWQHFHPISCFCCCPSAPCEHSPSQPPAPREPGILHRPPPRARRLHPNLPRHRLASMQLQGLEGLVASGDKKIKALCQDHSNRIFAKAQVRGVGCTRRADEGCGVCTAAGAKRWCLVLRTCSSPAFLRL